jgi:rod shape-determining protein MreD
MPPIDRRPGIRPRASVGRRLDIAARASFPSCATVLLMMLSQAPLDIAGQAALLPAVTLGCVWFWSLFRPANLPSPVVFVMGLVLDLLGYLPPGTGSFTLLVVQAVALALRRTVLGQGFLWIWLSFAIAATLASLLIWLLAMLLTFSVLPPSPAVFTGILAIALFPCLAVPFAVAHRSIADPWHA